jgi:hypothetical protein
MLVAEHLHADAGVTVLLAVPCLDSHMNDTVSTQRL